MKAMDRNGTAFLYLRQKFPLLSDAKIREAVFTGPDICSVLRDEVFERIITGDEQSMACLPRDGYRLLRKQKSRQLQGSCGRPSILISETGVQHVLENPLSEFSPGLLSGELWFCE